MNKVFYNEAVFDIDQARVPCTDAGLLYGAGVFETMRAVGTTVFRAKDHLERLFASAAKLSVAHSYETDSVLDAIRQTIEANDLSESRVRVTLTNGSATPDGGAIPTLLITAAEFVPYPQPYYENGVLVVLSDFRQNPDDPRAGHKTTSYFDRILALNKAHQKRAAEAIWFTTEQKLAEGSVSNVFLVKGGRLLTPAVDTPVLPGVMRRTVMEIAQEEKIECEEKDLFIKDLLSADEVFVSNVMMEVLPVIGVEAHTVGQGSPGAVTKKLLAGVRKRMDAIRG